MDFRRRPPRQRCLHGTNARQNRRIFAGLPNSLPISDRYLRLSKCLSAQAVAFRRISRGFDLICQPHWAEARHPGCPTINASIDLTVYWPFEWPE